MTIMATGGGVYIVTATKNKNKPFYLTSRCRRSVNWPLKTFLLLLMMIFPIHVQSNLSTQPVLLS